MHLSTYGALTKSVMAKIMVTNRRRPGDVHTTTISEFSNLITAKEGFLSTLQEGSEREMIQIYAEMSQRQAQ